MDTDTGMDRNVNLKLPYLYDCFCREAIEVFSYTLELLVQVHGKQHCCVGEMMCKLGCVYQVIME